MADAAKCEMSLIRRQEGRKVYVSHIYVSHIYVCDTYVSHTYYAYVYIYTHTRCRKFRQAGNPGEGD
jgi:hypothetical protein